MSSMNNHETLTQLKDADFFLEQVQAPSNSLMASYLEKAKELLKQVVLKAERDEVSRLYPPALFPEDDGDHSRDDRLL